jgi:phosphoribosylglycinamide formyltransferase 1
MNELKRDMESQPFSPICDRPIRLAVLISGGGTTMLNFLDQIQDGRLNAEIAVVISSRADCAGVTRAAEAGLECVVVRQREYDDVRSFSEHIFAEVRSHQADVVTMAGFLSLLHIPQDFESRVLNIHPSLIPAFSGPGCYGKHVHEQAIRRGVKLSGCTVHFADNEYDQGPIILQRSVAVPNDCDPDGLAGLVFQQEKEAYPEAIRLLAAGRITLCEGRVRILSPEE